MSDACTIYLDPLCDGQKAGPALRDCPVKLEVITAEGEMFIIAMTRSAWACLLKTGREVPGWIEPLRGDEDGPDNSAA